MSFSSFIILFKVKINMKDFQMFSILFFAVFHNLLNVLIYELLLMRHLLWKQEIILNNFPRSIFMFANLIKILNHGAKMFFCEIIIQVINDCLKSELHLYLVTYIFTKLSQNVCLIDAHILTYCYATCNFRLWKDSSFYCIYLGIFIYIIDDRSCLNVASLQNFQKLCV